MMPLASIQKYIIKVMKHLSFFYPSCKLFKGYDLFDVDAHNAMFVMSFVQKNKSLFYTIAHQTNSNISNWLYALRFEKTSNKNLISYLGIKLYNLLPPDMEVVNRMHLFASRVKPFIRENLPLIKNSMNF